MEDQSSVKYLVISNVVLMFFFVAQKGIEILISSVKRKQNKKEEVVENLQAQFQDIKLTMATMTAQMEIVIKQMFMVEKLKDDMNILFQKLRDKDSRE